jgi:hypothetical protein
MNETFERVDFDGQENVTPRLYRRTYEAAEKRDAGTTSC